MDNRRWHSGASPTPPSPPVSASVGYPTNGNVSTPATNPGEHWFHMIGEELRNVILGASLTPTHTLNNQLLTALNSGWNLPRNHAANGYQTLPGGLIWQWGVVGFADLSSSPAAANFAFPLTFPTAVYGVLATPAMTSGFNVMTSFQASVTSLSGGQIVLLENSALVQSALSVYWFSIGK